MLLCDAHELAGKAVTVPLASTLLPSATNSSHAYTLYNVCAACERDCLMASSAHKPWYQLHDGTLAGFLCTSISQHQAAA